MEKSVETNSRGTQWPLFLKKVNYIGGGGGVCDMSPVIKSSRTVGQSST